MSKAGSAANHDSSADAYSILFPAGILLGVAGVSIWPVYYFGVTSGYSGRSHMFVQSDCFLYAFIAGFLWTAIPRFTGTSAPARSLQYLLAAMLVAAAACFELQLFPEGHLLFLLAHILVVATLARRFLHRQSTPPATFALVGIGMLAGIIGAVINAGIAWQRIGPQWDLAGRQMLTEGMVLLLVLGIGGFLGPRLLGFAQLPTLPSIGKLGNDKPPGIWFRHAGKVYVACGFVIAGSVFAEYGYGIGPLAIMRAAVATMLIGLSLRPWQPPAARTTLAWCVWIAHWVLILGLWIVAAVPRYRIDFLHIIFMGAFTLLILAVGTRVVLSHGGHGLGEEKKSWPLRIGLTTGLIALLARLGAPFAPNSYFAHLAWAALLWICGMLFWGVYVLRRIRSAPKTAG